MTVQAQINIAGLRGTDNFTTGERPENFRETILWLNPNGEAPLTALLSKMKSEKTDDPNFHWFEESQGHVRPQITANEIVEATSVVEVDPDDIANGISGIQSIVSGDILVREDSAAMPGRGEQVLVISVNVATNEMTVTRGFGGTTIVAWTAGDRLTKVGTAFAEGTGAPDANTRNPAELLNFCQIFKSTIDLTETSRKTNYRTGDLEKNEKKRKMFDHSRDMEMAFWFGRRSLTTGANNKPRRTTAGLLDFITTNNKLYDTGPNTLDEDTFIDDISQMFNYDGQGAGDQRLAFCGNEALTTLNIMARDSASTRINFNGFVSAYGMKLMDWTIPQGTIYLKTHPLFNIIPGYSNMLAAINPAGIKYRALRDTQYKPNVQHNDEDTFKGQWISECGLEVNHEKTMTVLGGISRANFTP